MQYKVLNLQLMIGRLISGLLFLSLGFLKVEDGSLDLTSILLLFVIQLQKPLDDEKAKTTEHRSPKVVSLFFEHHLSKDGGDGGPHHGADDDARGGDRI